MMYQDLENFRQAVNEAITNNHALGLPVYQREGDYIIAIYPDGHKVQLDRVYDTKTESNLWYRPR